MEEAFAEARIIVDHGLVVGARATRAGARAEGSFDANLYAKRNVVERCVNRLKQWRSVATRYDKRATNYRAMVVIASLMIWLAP